MSTYQYHGYDIEVIWSNERPKNGATDEQIINHILNQPPLRGMGYPKKGSTITIKVLCKETNSGNYKYDFNWSIEVKNNYTTKAYSFEL